MTDVTRADTDADAEAGAATPRAFEPVEVDECMRLLGTATIGRLGYLRDGRIEILPMNYRFWEGVVVFRTGWGALIEVVHGQRVAFQVDVTRDDSRTGWSVLVQGVAEEIWQVDELQRARDEVDLEPWAPGEKEHWVRVLPNAISGRRIVG